MGISMYARINTKAKRVADATLMTYANSDLAGAGAAAVLLPT
jgi:hypothetical protein